MGVMEEAMESKFKKVFFELFNEEYTNRFLSYFSRQYLSIDSPIALFLALFLSKDIPPPHTFPLDIAVLRNYRKIAAFLALIFVGF